VLSKIRLRPRATSKICWRAIAAFGASCTGQLSWRLVRKSVDPKNFTVHPHAKRTLKSDAGCGRFSWHMI